jgi:biotin operon repressor
MNDTCKECNKKLEGDEISIYRRLVCRGANEYLCIECLSKHFKCSRDLILERISHFKEIGCTLFSK